MVTLLTLLALLLGSAAGTSARPASAGHTERPFGASSFWNAPLGRGTTLDRSSPALVAELRRQVAAFGPWINSTRVSTPVYEVPAGQPHVRVELDHPGAVPLRSALQAVPIPPDATAAAGGQGHMVIWQPATDTLWELWKASRRADGWHARYGGRMQDVSTNPGYFTDPSWWGATATSLPLLGGLIRISELRRGRIDHALAMGIPRTRAKAFSWPAQRTDGRVDDAGAIPLGARFRLDPELDLDALHLPAATRVLAEAAQRHGIVVRDTAGAVAFYAEDPSPSGTNPYPGLYGGRSPSKILGRFPWRHLQALTLDLHERP